MKKQFTIPILSSALILGASGTLNMPASAVSVDPETGQNIYTLEEMADLEKEMLIELEKVCGPDLNCQRDTLYDEAMEGGLSELVMLYMECTSFSITSVNPSEKTITVRFRNDSGSSRWSGATPSGNLVNFLRLGWSEPGYKTPLQLMMGRLPENESEAPAGFHFLFNGDYEHHEGEWFTESGKDYTIKLPESDFTAGLIGLIQFQYDMESGNTTAGYDISSCLKSPQYTAGMECRLTFAENYGPYYLPYSAPEEEKKEEVTTPVTPVKPAEKDPTDKTPKPETPPTSTPEINKPEVTPEVGPEVNPDPEEAVNITPSSPEELEEVASATDKSPSKTKPTDSAVSPSVVSGGLAETMAIASATNNSGNQPESKNDSIEPTVAASSSFTAPLGGERKELASLASTSSVDFFWWILGVIVVCDILLMAIFWPKRHRDYADDDEYYDDEDENSDL